MKNYKIAVFYGTSEGREILNFLADFSCNLFGFVATSYALDMQIDNRVNVEVGRLTKSEMQKKFACENFDFVVDATHPYAFEVSKNIKSACEFVGVKYLRIARETACVESENVRYFKSIGEVCEFLNGENGNIFLSTGSKNLAEFASFLNAERIFARVLPCVESLQLCESAGIKRKHIFAFEGPFSVNTNVANIQSSGAEFFVTKQTGNAGGFSQKVEACEKTGALLCVILAENQLEESENNSMTIGGAKEFFANLFGVEIKNADVKEETEIETNSIFENLKTYPLDSVESVFRDRIAKIMPSNKLAVARTKKRFNAIAKPLDGLGMLEEMICKIAGADENLDLAKKCTIVACADNGVVANGVTQTDSSVTAVVAGNIAKGEASVCLMSSVCGSDVFPLDVGMNTEASGVKVCKTMRGTRDFLVETAMDKEDALSAILVGMDAVGKAKANGYNIIATGEMGIGNTTTSSAVTAVLLGLDVESVTGKGAGLSADGVARKIHVIKAGIEKHNPDKADPIDVLCKIGGLDIACMCGMFLGGGESGTMVVCDGFISAVSALLAKMICENSVDFMLASHLSKERGGKMLLEKIGINPIIHANMALGEGTGCVAIFPLMDMAKSVLENMPSFGEIEIEEYKPL